MNYKSILIIFAVMFLLGCNKPDPHPELKDPIYQDLQREFAEAQKAVDAEKSLLAEHEKNLKEVIPQTGQIKYAQKRVSESLARLEKLKQLVKYWEIRIKTRENESRVS